jgi:hypothetical protein
MVAKSDKALPVHSERRSVHRTQWAAQFAVASELCKRGYEVAFTMGNHPSVDIMVNSPSGFSFGIDVKGLYRKNFWVVQPKDIKDRLFYVLAFVPDDGQNRFFILSQQQVNDAVAAGIEAARQRALDKGKSGDKAGMFPGISWPHAEKHQDWGILPG